MAAVFPIRTDQPWVFNGVTYEYDATEDRWFVISTTATDEIVSNIDTLNQEVIRGFDERDSLIEVASSKNNQQDAAIAELDTRVDQISSNIGVLEFKGLYNYELHKSEAACTAALAACLLDNPFNSECNRLHIECVDNIGQPVAPGKMTSWGSDDTLEQSLTEHLLFHNTDANGNTYDWVNTIATGDYIEVVEKTQGDTALYEVLQVDASADGPTINTEVNVKFLKETGTGDGNFNLTENYDIRIFKKDLGIDINEADSRYVQKPYVVYFEDNASDITPVHSSGNLQNGELWYDTDSLELFAWNNNAWTATARPPSNDSAFQSLQSDVDDIRQAALVDAQRLNSLITDTLLENNIYYSDGPPVGDITGTLRNGDLWVDSDDLTIKFYSMGAWINPDRQVGGDYLETTGGKMTGAINSKVGGTNNVALVITNAGNDDQCLNIWAPGGAGQQIKYVGRNNTQHWFQVYDDTNSNPLTTTKFGYETYSFLAKPNVTYAATDAHYFKSNVFFNNGNGDLKAKVSNSNFDFFNLARFKEGFVIKRPGATITGDNSFTAYPDYVSYSGRMENNNDIVNKQYVDTRTKDATVSQKGIAKLGKVAKGTSVPSLEQGQLFYNTSTKVLLIKT